MDFYEANQHPAIRGYWSIEEQAQQYNTQSIIPDSTIELVINCGAPLVLYGPAKPPLQLPRVFIKGLQHKPLQLRVNGTMAQLIGVRLNAWSLPALPDVRFDRANNIIIPLDGKWQDMAKTISDTVSQSGYAGAVHKLEDFLNTAYQPHEALQTLSTAGQRLYETQGTINIQDLANRSHISLSQLERQFKRATGTTLKRMARLVRFEAARDTLYMNPTYKLADLAHELGYTDQSHFTHDFKAFAGFTPGLRLPQDADFLQDH